jgi:FAD synthase
VERLRDEMKFNGPEALITQMKADEAHSRKILM